MPACAHLHTRFEGHQVGQQMLRAVSVGHCDTQVVVFFCTADMARSGQPGIAGTQEAWSVPQKRGKRENKLLVFKRAID
jgi:hypothetical protein